jgi:hypothetical protein
MIISLSPLISESTVPIEDWISTVSVLIDGNPRYQKRFQDEIHSTIHSICMASTYPSHVRSLVEEGILGYWDKVLGSSGDEDDRHLDVLESISHLTSIDNRLRLRAHYELGG